MLKLSYALLLLCCIGNSFTSLLPSFITPCYRDDPLVSECVTRQGRLVQKQFAKGLPDIGFPQLDPMAFGGFSILTGGRDGLNIVAKNSIIKGLADAQIKAIDLNLKDEIAKLSFIGNVTLISDVEMSGNLLIFPVTGKGRMIMKAYNLDGIFTWTWDEYLDEEGRPHYKIQNITNKYSIGDAKIRLDGLFGNDKTLTRSINEVANDNWRELLNDVGPAAIQAVSAKVKDAINILYAKVPAIDILPLTPKA